MKVDQIAFPSILIKESLVIKSPCFGRSLFHFSGLRRAVLINSWREHLFRYALALFGQQWLKTKISLFLAWGRHLSVWSIDGICNVGRTVRTHVELYPRLKHLLILLMRLISCNHLVTGRDYVELCERVALKLLLGSVAQKGYMMGQMHDRL